MNKSVLIATLMLAAACGGEPKKDPTSAPQPSNSASATTAAPAVESERAKTGAKYLKDITGEGIGLGQQARLSANGLSEPIFELPADVRKGLAAITGEAVDPSQYARIVGAMFDGALGPAAEKVCHQPIQKVLNAMQGIDIADRSGFVIKTCGLESSFDATTAKKANPAYLLLSASVTQLLKDSGKSSAGDLGMAKLLANFGRAD
jgi:hypothetical protein